MSQSVHGLTLTCSSHLLTKCQQFAEKMQCDFFPFPISSFLLLGSPLCFCIQQAIKNWRQERPVIEANREVYNMDASKFFQTTKWQLNKYNCTTEQITRTQLASDSQGMKKSCLCFLQIHSYTSTMPPLFTLITLQSCPCLRMVAELSFTLGLCLLTCCEGKTLS